MNANSSCETIPPSSGTPSSEASGTPASGAARDMVVPPARRSSLREAPPLSSSGRGDSPPSSRGEVPPSSRSEAARRASLDVLQGFSKLAPGITSKLNLAADCMLVIAASAVSTLGRVSWHHTAFGACVALGVWMLGARVLRHYDAWSEGLFGELAVTSVLVISVGVTLVILNQFVPGPSHHSGVGTFLMLTWPGLWFVRASVVAIRAWRHSPPEQVLIIGTGPLGRVTGEDIRDTSKHPPSRWAT